MCFLCWLPLGEIVDYKNLYRNLHQPDTSSMPSQQCESVKDEALFIILLLLRVIHCNLHVSSVDVDCFLLPEQPQINPVLGTMAQEFWEFKSCTCILCYWWDFHKTNYKIWMALPSPWRDIDLWYSQCTGHTFILQELEGCFQPCEMHRLQL